MARAVLAALAIATTVSVATGCFDWSAAPADAGADDGAPDCQPVPGNTDPCLVVSPPPDP